MHPLEHSSVPRTAAPVQERILSTSSGPRRSQPVSLEPGLAAQWACVLEATAPKPGNVHRGADFEDMTYLDMVLAASLIGPPMQKAWQGTPVGEVVLECVQRIRQHIGRNTHLGTVLLLAPLAKLVPENLNRSGVHQVLEQLTPQDAQAVFEAIRLAAPGGLGRSQRYDVHQQPPDNLLEAMAFAASRDRVARQYATDFVDLWNVVLPELEQALGLGLGLGPAIVHTHLRLLARWPDSLIARKCGQQQAEDIRIRAMRIVEQYRPGTPEYHFQLAELDFYLRSDGHRRNPGTTADLITAGLFVLLRQGRLELPLRWLE